MKETLQTIAQRLNISATTVSRVLSGNAEKYRISSKTQELIKNEALRCKYTPSMVARSLRTQKTNMIGLILPSVSNKFFADIAGTVISECRNNGYITIVMDIAEKEEFQRDCISSLAIQGVDGMIIAPCGDDPSQLEMINRDHFPVVLIDRYFKSSSLTYVTANNLQGGTMAVRHLISQGHKRIACIQGVIESIPNQKRVNGYIQAMTEAELEENINIRGNSFSIQNGYVETKLLISDTSSPRPTAIFALSNTIALGVVKALKESNLRIPEDISIISFDDNIYLDYMEPPITRVTQPVEGMAKLAVRLLLNAISTPAEERVKSELKLSSELIQRESVLSLK